MSCWAGSRRRERAALGERARSERLRVRDDPSTLEYESTLLSAEQRANRRKLRLILLCGYVVPIVVWIGCWQAICLAFWRAGEGWRMGMIYSLPSFGLLHGWMDIVGPPLVLALTGLTAIVAAWFWRFRNLGGRELVLAIASVPVVGIGINLLFVVWLEMATL